MGPGGLEGAVYRKPGYPAQCFLLGSLRALDTTAQGWYLEDEVLIKLWAAGFTFCLGLVEVPFIGQ